MGFLDWLTGRKRAPDAQPEALSAQGLRRATGEGKVTTPDHSTQTEGVAQAGPPAKGRFSRRAIIGCALAIPVGIALLLCAGAVLFGRPRYGSGGGESGAAWRCRSYALAQSTYKRTDWDGDWVLVYATPYTKLYSQKDKAGKPIQLISPALAGAQGATGAHLFGYLYQDMETIGGAKIDWADEFALCATPARYGEHRSRSTFIVSSSGTVWYKDLGKSEFVKDYPANPAAEGWRKME